MRRMSKWMNDIQSSEENISNSLLAFVRYSEKLWIRNSTSLFFFGCCYDEQHNVVATTLALLLSQRWIRVEWVWVYLYLTNTMWVQIMKYFLSQLSCVLIFLLEFSSRKKSKQPATATFLVVVFSSRFTSSQPLLRVTRVLHSNNNNSAAAKTSWVNVEQRWRRKNVRKPKTMKREIGKRQKQRRKK